jgi:hypothetical protein
MASFVNPLINTLAQTSRTTSHFLITQQEKFLGTLSCTPIMLHRQCSPSKSTSSTASTRNILSAVAMQKAIEDCYNPPAEYNKLWNSQKEVLKHNHKAPGHHVPGLLDDSNGPN